MALEKLPEFPTECFHSNTHQDPTFCAGCSFTYHAALYKFAKDSERVIADLREAVKLEELRHQLWYDNAHISADVYMKQENEVLRLRSALHSINQVLYSVVDTDPAVIERIQAIIKDVMFQVS